MTASLPVSSADLVHVAFLELGQGGVLVRACQAVRVKFFYGDLIFFDDLQIFVVRNFQTLAQDLFFVEQHPAWKKVRT